MKKISVCLIALLLTRCYYNDPMIPDFRGKEMPSFDIMLLDSVNKVNTNTIMSGKPTVLFYFFPDCPFCRAQTEEIIGDHKLFQDVNFFLLSTASLTDLKTYYRKYDLHKYANITMGKDFQSYFESYYKAPQVPYMAIYNADKKLKEIAIGKISKETLNNLIIK